MLTLTINRLDDLNYYLFFCFLVEMLLKILGLGVKNYVKDKFNIFDSLLVLLSIVETILKNIEYTS
jgi:hypothetical protein